MPPVALPPSVLLANSAYFDQLQVASVTGLELATWVDQSTPRTRETLLKLGFVKCLQLPTFQQYVLERRGFVMRDFMRQRLSEADFTAWDTARQHTRRTK